MDKIILKILNKLISNGYEAYVVGGYVRDKILGIKTNDIDICTNALPLDIIRIFKLDKNTIDNYGCISLNNKKYNIEITTYREEFNYNNRKPDEIKFIKTYTEDLKRRDFTINSILLNNKEEIIDTYNGIKDLNDKKIKCIGNTQEKLKEDPLRILRAIRFAIIYNFELDKEIIEFIKDNKTLIKNLSYYRKRQELDKILMSNNRIKGLEFITKLDILDELEIEFKDIKNSNNLYGMYAQIEMLNKYQFTHIEQKNINDIKEIIKYKNIDNKILYKYGLNICLIASDILGIDKNKLKAQYKRLPIKDKKDIKINHKSIVKFNNNCYNNLSEIYNDIENKILDGILKNKKKDIKEYLRK